MSNSLCRQSAGRTFTEGMQATQDLRAHLSHSAIDTEKQDCEEFQEFSKQILFNTDTDLAKAANSVNDLAERIHSDTSEAREAREYNAKAPVSDDERRRLKGLRERYQVPQAKKEARNSAKKLNTGASTLLEARELKANQPAPTDERLASKVSKVIHVKLQNIIDQAIVENAAHLLILKGCKQAVEEKIGKEFTKELDEALGRLQETLAELEAISAEIKSRQVQEVSKVIESGADDGCVKAGADRKWDVTVLDAHLKWNERVFSVIRGRRSQGVTSFIPRVMEKAKL